MNMVKWTEIHNHLVGNIKAEVELMAMMWRQAAVGDDSIHSNLVMNAWSVSGLSQQLDWYGVVPDEVTLEWLRIR
jgi:hypothetical protein